MGLNTWGTPAQFEGGGGRGIPPPPPRDGTGAAGTAWDGLCAPLLGPCPFPGDSRLDPARGEGDPAWKRSGGLPPRCRGAGICPAVTARCRTALDTCPLPARLPFTAALCRQGSGRVSRCRQRWERDCRRHSAPDRGAIPCVSRGPSTGTPSNLRPPRCDPCEPPGAGSGAVGPSGAGMGAKGPGPSLNGIRRSCSGPWGSASTQFCPGGCPRGDRGGRSPLRAHAWPCLRA